MNRQAVENIVAKLVEKANNAESSQAIWARTTTYQKHVDKRLEKGHVSDEADYFAKIKRTLATTTHFNYTTGKYAEVELVGGDWSVILSGDGLINTAYKHEEHGESFSKQKTRLGHRVYEYEVGEGLSGQLKKLFG